MVLINITGQNKNKALSSKCHCLFLVCNKFIPFESVVIESFYSYYIYFLDVQNFPPKIGEKNESLHYRK